MSFFFGIHTNDIIFNYFQIVLSHYRHGNINQAKSLFSKLYNNDNGDNEVYEGF